MTADSVAAARDVLLAAADRVQTLADAVVPNEDGEEWYTAAGIVRTIAEPDGADAQADAHLIELSHPETWRAVAAWLRFTAGGFPHSIPAQKLAERVLAGASS